ncbi:MAG: acetyltransferase [Acidobacteriia bacterium]|nr:acetyltransferase [Terriglobia bacterium]
MGCRVWRQIGPGFALLVCPVATFAQFPILPTAGGIRIFNTDMAVLETQDIRKDIACTVTPDKPILGFDLRFHAGYEVNVPLKDLSGGENQLTILFRVTPDNRKEDPSYFVQHIRVPSIEEDAKGEANLGGSIDLGEGTYHVDWLMRDRSERVCSFYWDMDATLAPKDKQIELAIASDAVQAVNPEQFTDEPPIERAHPRQPLNIKVLVNFAPQNSEAAALRPVDTLALVSILRRIAREPQFGKFSIVAFNMQEQRVLYRQKSEDKIDFPALGDAIHSIKLGTVDLKRLAQKHADTEFLTDLIRKEMSTEDRPDALVFAGPKVMLDEAVPQETLKPLADVDYPVFYMNYALNPAAVPWKDSISRAIKVFKGTEYTISRPRDLWFAMTEMVSRIVKSKHGRAASPVSAQGW